MIPSTSLRILTEAGPPEVAIVLGSALGAVARRLRLVASFPFGDIPGLAKPSTVGHRGWITIGDWVERRVLVFEGRLHYFEGHPWRQVTLPMQMAAHLGARIVLLTNAAGGIHDALQPGCLMAVRDHLDWSQSSCFWRPEQDRPSPYSSRLLGRLDEAARRVKLSLLSGVYAALTGPCYETPAEIRALRACGADAVGMSTAREALAAHDLGLEVAAVSCITNRAAGLASGPITSDEVIVTAGQCSESLGDLIEEFLALV